MIATPNYYPIEGGAWMTLAELEALGSWDWFNESHVNGGVKKTSAYAALAAVGSYGGFAMPNNGMHVRISQVDMTALLGEMVPRPKPVATANDGNAS